jgi:membrane protein implicated in regulation of membrane protease activity
VRWLKVAAIVVGVMIAFLVISSVIGFLLEALIAVLAVAVIALAIKVAVSRKRVSWRSNAELRRRSRSLRGRKAPDPDDDLARLKREMGG